jgi:hypothetical protein
MPEFLGDFPHETCRCGAKVSKDFARVCSDDFGLIWRCPTCYPPEVPQRAIRMARKQLENGENPYDNWYTTGSIDDEDWSDPEWVEAVRREAHEAV